MTYRGKRRDIKILSVRPILIGGIVVGLWGRDDGGGCTSLYPTPVIVVLTNLPPSSSRYIQRHRAGRGGAA